MADLSEKDASGSTKIVGANTSGTEQDFVGSTVNGELKVSDADAYTLLSGKTTSGSLTAAAQAVTLTSDGMSTAGVLVTGTWAGSIFIQGSIDGTSWVSLRYYDPATLTIQILIGGNITAVADIGGYRHVRVLMSSYTSGSAAVTLTVQPGDNTTVVLSPLASGFLSTAYIKDASGNTFTNTNPLPVADIPSQVGLNAVLNLTTTAIEGKVGGSTMTNRKYVEMQALSNNIKWGYDTSCPFDLFKSQFFSLPAGTTCKVYFKMSTGTGTVAFGEK